MQVRAIKTPIITAGAGKTIEDILAESLSAVTDKSVIVISSKIVALCEGAVAPLEGIDKEELIRSEADLYLDPSLSVYGHHFTVKHNTLVGSSGIDESNGADHYVLWPRDPQASANKIRAWLRDTYNLQSAGVIITDSTSYPMRRGAMGVAIAHSGFKAIASYIGQKDLFGRELKLETANIAGGLAAAAVLVMGEGSEQTPIAIINDVSFVEFDQESPTKEELGSTYLSLEADLFSPFWQRVPWQQND